MKKLFIILSLVLTVLAQEKYKITDYFPTNSGNIWEYRNTSNHFDTATITTNVQFIGNFVSSLKYSISEIEYFKCDSNGLYMVGQTNYLGTFNFVNPIGIANSEISVGDNIESNWYVNFGKYKSPIYWGNVIARVENHIDTVVVQGKKYYDILVIGVYLYGKSPLIYYMAKNIGIITSEWYSSNYGKRELLNYHLTLLKIGEKYKTESKKLLNCNNKIRFLNRDNDALVEIFNMSGKKLNSISQFKLSVVDLKTIGLNKGVYLVRIITKDYKFKIKVNYY